MSLVDYDSSSEEEDDPKPKQPPQFPPQVPCLNQQKESGPVALKLPDAGLLLSSSTLASSVVHTTDHSSWVSESTSKKRDLSNLSSSSNCARQKVPKANLPNAKRVPGMVVGNMIPPQLTGRSNVATEDISKLFAKRHANSSSLG